MLFHQISEMKTDDWVAVALVAICIAAVIGTLLANLISRKH